MQDFNVVEIFGRKLTLVSTVLCNLYCKKHFLSIAKLK